MAKRITGVFAAAATPLAADLAPAPDELPPLLDHLAGLGCHGALLLGSTGEGPSFSVGERVAVFRAAAAWRAAQSGSSFTLIAGTGCANLPDTIAATRAACEAGMDAVLLLPAFYYKTVRPSGLTEYFRRVVHEAVPVGRSFLLYHIPSVSGVPITPQTIADLATEFPERMAGLKDSGADLGHTRELCRAFPGLAIFTGTDSHLAGCMEAGGAGAITALGNVYGDLLRAVFDGRRRGVDVTALQARLTAVRGATDGYVLVSAVKALLADVHGLPRWPVRPPLESLTPDERRDLLTALEVASGR